jgi:hypothetical protein
MRPSRVFEKVNPCFEGTAYLHDFEVFGLENSSAHSFRTKRLESEGDISAFIVKVWYLTYIWSSTWLIIFRMCPLLTHVVHFACCMCWLWDGTYIDCWLTIFRYSRHREHLQQEIRPAFPAYSQSITTLLHDRFGIPETYHQLRTYANACGTFQKYLLRAQDGTIECVCMLNLMPRPG